jgi:hypothetical protein
MLERGAVQAWDIGSEEIRTAVAVGRANCCTGNEHWIYINPFALHADRYQVFNNDKHGHGSLFIVISIQQQFNQFTARQNAQFRVTLLFAS